MPDEVCPLREFCSSRNPLHKVEYTLLNPGAPQTLRLCYGAGGRAVDLTLYQTFADTHPMLALLCVDRWTLPNSRNDETSPDIVARNGPAILSELTTITVELLDSLSIGSFSVAAHSAGVYQLLDLVKRCAETGRVRNVYPISTHIPPTFFSSTMMTLMSKVPDIIFGGITKLDASFINSSIGRLSRRVFAARDAPGQEESKFVDSQTLRETLAAYKPIAKQRALIEERARLDYNLAYARLQGVSVELLTDLYLVLRQWSDIHVTWFTCDGDVFFGPASVQKVVDEMAEERKIKVVNVPFASHADIFRRKQVWDEMYNSIMDGNG